MSNNIRRVDDDRVAGIGRLFFLEVGQLVLPVARAGAVVVGELNLIPGALWRELESTIYTAQLDTTGEQTQHGTIYTHELAGFFEGDAPGVASLFASLAGRRFAVLLRDFNQKVRLAGGDHAGLLFTYKWQSGTKPRERKGYSWSFKGRTLTPALFYDGAAPLLADSGGVLPPPTGGSGYVQVYDRRGNLMKTVPAGSKLIVTSGFKVYLRIE